MCSMWYNRSAVHLGHGWPNIVAQAGQVVKKKAWDPHNLHNSSTHPTTMSNCVECVKIAPQLYQLSSLKSIVLSNKRNQPKGMITMTFTKSKTYTATNTRTGETFKVTCTHNSVGYATFTDANGKTFKGFKRDSALTYNVVALDVRNHVSVACKAA